MIALVKDKQEVSLYVNGEFISSRVREDVPPVYSTQIILGRMDITSNPFKGTIYHARLFNFAPAAEDAAVFYNNGDPAGYVMPAEMKSGVVAGCIAEYVPQNVTSGAWLDSSKQLPVNGNLPPLWKSAGGYDLTASGTPEIVYKSVRRENMDVLAESECSLEGRIARLEKALIDLTSGRTFIPKLTVKELEVWGANNLIVTGEGAPTKAPDRAGQIYIDTKNNAQYRSTGNAAVSDWKNA